MSTAPSRCRRSRRGSRSYYHRHGLAFFTTAPPQGTTMAYALDTNNTALGLALIAAFPGVDLQRRGGGDGRIRCLYHQVVTFVANFMLKPMVDFANTHSDGGGAATNLIVVPQLERPGGDADQRPRDVAGGPGDLAGAAGRVRPHHARRGGDLGGREPARQLHADDGPRQQRAQARGQHRSACWTISSSSHEFGHTGALVHSLEPRNLMFQGVTPGLDDCTDSLDDAQLALMARHLRARGRRRQRGAAGEAPGRARRRPPVRRAAVVVHARPPARDAGRRSAGDAVIRGAALSRPPRSAPRARLAPRSGHFMPSARRPV